MLEGISPSSFIRGAILSVIFGTVATIPWILVSTFTGFYVSFLGFLIGLAAIKGFTIGAGHEHSSALLVAIPVVIMAIPLAEVVSWYIVFIRDGYYVPLEYFFQLMNESGLGGQMIKNVVIGYIIAGLGVFSLFKNFRNV